MTKKSDGPRKSRKNRPTGETAVEQALPFPPASPAPETQAQASAPVAPAVQAPTQEAADYGLVADEGALPDQRIQQPFYIFYAFPRNLSQTSG